MKNTLLYIVTVLIWGTTWIAIEYQVNEAPVEVTLFYRFAFAGLIMLIYSYWTKLPLAFKLKDHCFILLLALFNFSGNYFILYESQKYLNSAMASIAFSTLLVFNIINTRLFFGAKIKPKVYLGALMGLGGIVLLFYPSIAGQHFEQSIITGLLLALAGTVVASFGNMVSVRNSRQGINILSANTWGMIYGSIVMLVMIFITDVSFVLPTVKSYWLSLGYVSVFGTVIAFASYFMLLDNIGPEKASYSIVMFPVVAIIISIAVEDFQVTGQILSGILLIGLGNLIVLGPLEKVAWLNGKKKKRGPQTNRYATLIK